MALPDYGFKERDVVISIEGIIENFERAGVEPHSGYVTMGDNNSPIYDQKPSGYMLVKPEWVVGKAFGELPWFGLIKLTITGEIRGDAPPNSWTNLIISIIIILGIPLFIDFGLPKLKRKKDGNGEHADAGGSEEIEDGAETEGPTKIPAEAPADQSKDGATESPAEETATPPVEPGEGLSGETSKETLPEAPSSTQPEEENIKLEPENENEKEST